MLDYRIHTFLKLCDTMNYRIAAEQLNMTQPSVTQHIQYLERVYGCRLFSYQKRRLSITREGRILEKYARTEIYNEALAKAQIRKEEKHPLRIGATKTIGDYVIKDNIAALATNPDYQLSVVVDNTKNLLHLLDHSLLDIAVIEGFFNKDQYGYELFRMEPFVGICSTFHPFAGKTVDMAALTAEKLIVREQGSGTRAIFEEILMSSNFSLESFDDIVCMSSFQLIEACIVKNMGITMAYEAFAKSSPGISTFNIATKNIKREFNFVYLKHSNSFQILKIVRDILS